MATQPRSRADWQLRFLQAEEGSTERLVSFYRQAHEELADFIVNGDLPLSDEAYFRNRLRGVDQTLADLEVQVEAWARETALAAYKEGAATHSGTSYADAPEPEGAIRALSSDTLDLIRQTRPAVRRSIQSAVAQGILQGLSGQELRSRIASTGLRPGRWPSIEYRAGVIARTETLRAYNRGAEDGIVQAGAGLVVWIISPDEAVCPLCGPLGGKTFTLPNVSDAERAAWPDAQPRPPIPRHPRCRCSQRAQFRTPGGNLIGAAEPVDPSTPDGGVSADQPATLPVSQGEIEAEAQRLAEQAAAAAGAIEDAIQAVTDGRTVGYRGALGITDDAAWEAWLKEPQGVPGSPERLAHENEFARMLDDSPGAPRAADGGDLAGWENRRKGIPSVIDKIERAFSDNPKLATVEEAGATIRDLNRYTVRVNADEYTRTTRAVYDALVAAGNEPLKFHAKGWQGTVYRGINSNWRSPEGSVFEVQFHTPASFQTKERNHPPYVERRRLALDDPRGDELDQEMAARAANAESPDGWEALLELQR